MNGLYKTGFSYGVAIIVITVIIKLFFLAADQCQHEVDEAHGGLFQPQNEGAPEKCRMTPGK